MSLPFLTPTELLVVKRKRGRPKGSTKKCYAEEESAENTTSAPSESVQPGPEGGGGLADVPADNLECQKCNRKFSNSRQLRKHICILVKNEDLEEEGDSGELKLCYGA